MAVEHHHQPLRVQKVLQLVLRRHRHLLALLSHWEGHPLAECSWKSQKACAPGQSAARAESSAGSHSHGFVPLHCAAGILQHRLSPFALPSLSRPAQHRDVCMNAPHEACSVGGRHAIPTRNKADTVVDVLHRFWWAAIICWSCCSCCSCLARICDAFSSCAMISTCSHITWS